LSGPRAQVYERNMHVLTETIVTEISQAPTVLATHAGKRAPWRLFTERQRWSFLGVLFLVTTSNYFDYNVLSILLEPIKEEFRVSDTKLGLLSGAMFAMVYALAGLPIARWADRGNRRTVMVLAVSGWSAMTLLCGMAQSFWQLALARFGLGATESGGIPPAQSLVMDYFPPERQGFASSVLISGTSAGYLVGVVLGGSIAAAWGWRMAFTAGGIAGLALAIAVRWVIPEPRLQLGFPECPAQNDTIWRAFTELARKRTFLYTLIAISVYQVFACGFQAFLPAFMMRTLHTSLAEVSLVWGLAISAASLIGALFGGWLGDRLGQRDVRWYGWLPAAGCLASVPFYVLAIVSTRFSSFIVADFLAETVLAIGLGVCFIPILTVCGDHRRTMGMALTQLSFMVVGGGLGPVLAGSLSDFLGGSYGVQGLRYALAGMIVFLIPAAAAFVRAGRMLPLERTE